MEELAAALGDALEAPLADALEPEHLVVQSRGMALWLNQEIAKRHGVAANLEFLYPKNFIQRVFREVLGERFETYRFTRDHLTWATLAELPGLLASSDLARLRAYLDADRSGLRQIQLCEQIAQLFDQYLTYRPELIRRWEAPNDRTHRTPRSKETAQLGLFTDSEPEAWQRKIWQRVSERLGKAHVAALEDELSAVLGREQASLGALPRRLFVFGISTLPPLYLRVLIALGRHVEVQLFLLSPCREYWFDLPAGAANADGDAAAPGHATPPLLASLGLLGAQFAESLNGELERQGIYEAEAPRDLYRSSTRATLLGRLQADLLDLRTPIAATNGKLAPDQSIQVHSCHSPLREVEVLHDHLLDLLTRDSDLEPHQVVVMMPNVDAYAPFIEAVFSRPSGDGTRIPYQIADRAVRHEGEVLNAFLRILDLVGARLGASDVIDLLTLSAVGERLAFTPRDIELVGDWITKSGIRWGLDAAHRASEEQPAETANTWVFGLKRLLLGYAIEEPDTDPFEGVLPFSDLGSGNAVLLGKLVDFCDRLFSTLEDLSHPRSLLEWQQVLVNLAHDLLLLDDDSAWQHRRIRQCLQDLLTTAEEAAFGEQVPFAVIRALLISKLDEPLPAHGFMSGGVTFCALVPMRSIPFRVVALLGMGDAAFPRIERAVDFDLMAARGSFRSGDPARKADDRYLFLEALISARERLFISYTGQNIRDNSAIAPSIVVSELLEQLAAGSAAPEARTAVLNAIVVNHPLQAFSPRYFDGKDPRLFSYETSYLNGARSLDGNSRAPQPFFERPLPERDHAELDFADLLRFFERPCAHLFRFRLDVDLRESIVDIEDREPCELSALQRFRLGDSILRLLLDGANDGRIETVVRASGELPPGALGTSTLGELLALAHPIAAAVNEAGYLEPTQVLSIDLDLGQARLAVELERRPKRGLLRFRFGRLDARQLLTTWVTHLIANCRLGVSSALFGRSDDDDVHRVHFPEIASAKPMLEPLVALYEIGQRQPLRLFPQASLAYVKHLRSKPADGAGALKAANDQWKEMLKYDPHLIRLYGENSRLTERGPEGGPDLGRSFSELAKLVFEPLLDHSEGA